MDYFDSCWTGRWTDVRLPASALVLPRASAGHQPHSLTSNPHISILNRVQHHRRAVWRTWISSLLYCSIGMLHPTHRRIHNGTSAGFWDPVGKDIFPVGVRKTSGKPDGGSKPHAGAERVSPSVEARREPQGKQQQVFLVEPCMFL